MIVSVNYYKTVWNGESEIFYYMALTPISRNFFGDFYPSVNEKNKLFNYTFKETFSKSSPSHITFVKNKISLLLKLILMKASSLKFGNIPK